jgi:Tol biopolymer transport system component
MYAAPGRLFYIQQGALMERSFNAERGEFTGEPVPVASPVDSDGASSGGFSVSQNGTLAYRTGASERRQLMWFDRAGTSLNAAAEPDDSNLNFPELSPDGHRVAVARTVQNNQDVWIIDLVRGGATRFTTDPSEDNYPLWSPDGKWIAFASSRNGPNDIFRAMSESPGSEEIFWKTPNPKGPHDWSRDGRFLLYGEISARTGFDLWAVQQTGQERKAFAVVNTAATEMMAQLSPDGRWLAYQSDESGKPEIYIHPFPEPGGKWPVSTNGGVQPRWSANGKELYFIAPDGKMMSAKIDTSGVTPERGTPLALFRTRIVGGATVNKQEYAVSRDGRFLINVPAGESSTPPISLILNWKPPVSGK